MLKIENNESRYIQDTIAIIDNNNTITLGKNAKVVINGVGNIIKLFVDDLTDLSEYKECIKDESNQFNLVIVYQMKPIENLCISSVDSYTTYTTKEFI